MDNYDAVVNSEAQNAEALGVSRVVSSAPHHRADYSD